MTVNRDDGVITIERIAQILDNIAAKRAEAQLNRHESEASE